MADFMSSVIWFFSGMAKKLRFPLREREAKEY